MCSFNEDNVSELTDNLSSQYLDLEEVELSVLKEMDSFNDKISTDYNFQINEHSIVSLSLFSCSFKLKKNFKFS